MVRTLGVGGFASLKGPERARLVSTIGGRTAPTRSHMQPHTIRDRIAARTSVAPLRLPAFAIISATQDVDPATRLEALALTLSLACQTAGLDVHDVVTRARRQISDAECVRSAHIEAIRDLIAGERR